MSGLVEIKPVMVTGDMDCTRACVATILGLPTQNVPNFYRMAGDDADNVKHSVRMKQAMRDYLASKGMGLFETYCNGDWPLEKAVSWASGDNPGCPIILHGKPAHSPEPAHSVVLLDGKIAHDPSGAGIAAPLDCDGQRWWFFDVICVTAVVIPVVMEHCAGIMDERAAMYRDKADECEGQFDPMWSESEVANSNAVASEYGAAAIRGEG